MACYRRRLNGAAGASGSDETGGGYGDGGRDGFAGGRHRLVADKCDPAKQSERQRRGQQRHGQRRHGHGRNVARRAGRRQRAKGVGNASDRAGERDRRRRRVCAHDQARRPTRPDDRGRQEPAGDRQDRGIERPARPLRRQVLFGRRPDQGHGDAAQHHRHLGLGQQSGRCRGAKRRTPVNFAERLQPCRAERQRFGRDRAFERLQPPFGAAADRRFRPMSRSAGRATRRSTPASRLSPKSRAPVRSRSLATRKRATRKSTAPARSRSSKPGASKLGASTPRPSGPRTASAGRDRVIRLGRGCGRRGRRNRRRCAAHCRAARPGPQTSSGRPA